MGAITSSRAENPTHWRAIEAERREHRDNPLHERVKMLAPPPRTDSGRRVYHSTGTLPPLGAVEAARVTVATLGQNAF